ncbi:MAG: cob(I)yrinic acid a,c-diamide adenosyltransferase [Candidatus Aenigmatarchaeota archaeon]
MGVVCVFTGNGKGKTSAAFGMAMRFLGHNKRVVVIQFLKGTKTGELLLKRNLPGLDIVQFGTEFFVDLKSPSKEDKQRAIEAILYAKKIMKGPFRPDLMILDEANVAVTANMINEEDLMDLISAMPEEMNLVITGREAPPKLLERADMVTEMREIKHPFAKGQKAKEGIEY